MLPCVVAVSLVLAVSGVACRPPERQVQARGTGGESAQPVVQPSLSALLDSLARLPGEFRLVGFQWQFSGDDHVFRSIADHRDSAVVHLVDCLDRVTPAAATVEGRRVPVGVLCYAALQRTAYSTEHEDGTGEWPGFLEPTATAEELTAAKTAWLEVVRTRRYKLT